MQNALIPLLGVHFKNLRFGYSYDITLSKLRSVSEGLMRPLYHGNFPALKKEDILGQ